MAEPALSDPVIREGARPPGEALALAGTGLLAAGVAAALARKVRRHPNR